jgi:small GTP-binding protein
VLCGSSNVGKTCLFLRYLRGSYQPNSPSTIGVEFGSRTIDETTRAGIVRIKLQVWDTAGSERYKSLAKSYLKGAAIVLLVFDLTSLESFKDLEGWL